MSFLVVIISAGLIVQKVRLGLKTKRFHAFETSAQEHLTEYLFCEIGEIDYEADPAAHRRALAPFVDRLRQHVVLSALLDRPGRRDALRRVMLDISANIKGETLARLIFAFDQLGFVADEIRNTSSAKWWIRASACRNLRVMHSDQASEALVHRLDDENEDVRIEASQTLVDTIGVYALSPILLTIKEISPWMEVRLSQSILRFGTEAVPHLAKGIKSESSRVQRFCVRMLGEIGEVYAVPIILEYIDYEQPDVQNESLIALGKLGDERAVPIILKYVGSNDERLRISAAKALGSLSSPATADVLNKLLLKDTVDVRLAAAEALTKLGDVGIKTLEYSSRTNDPQVRLVAYQFLHELGRTMQGTQMQ